jgi:hypothetical protein
MNTTATDRDDDPRDVISLRSEQLEALLNVLGGAATASANGEVPRSALETVALIGVELAGELRKASLALESHGTRSAHDEEIVRFIYKITGDKDIAATAATMLDSAP